MAAKVLVLSFRDPAPKGVEVIEVNATSQSAVPWQRALSSFFLGPIDLYGGRTSLNMENAWQYCKVYPRYADGIGNPTRVYWAWAEIGWASQKANRYPMGKDAVPLYSLWDGQRLSYVEARKRIYIPLYARAVRNTDAFRELRTLYEQSHVLVIRDFDAYPHELMGRTLSAVVEDPTRKMGHGFVLAMLLLGDPVLSEISVGD